MNLVTSPSKSCYPYVMYLWFLNVSVVLPSYLSTKSAFYLSGLAGRTSQIANEIDFFHRVFAENASPSCILKSGSDWSGRIVLIKSEILMRREWSGWSVLTNGKRPKFVKRSETHSYCTIQNNQLNLPQCRTSSAQCAFRFRASKYWNSLPNDIRTLPLLGFLKGVPGLR